MKNKIEGLIKEKESKLNAYVVERSLDSERNLHVLCKMETDGSYTVWTSYYTGEEKTSYVDFYNGSHGLSLKQAIEEFHQRIEAPKKMENDIANDRVDVMVDIETLGTKSDSTIFQISALAFNLFTGETTFVFSQIADIEENEQLNVDGSTLKWWLNTDKELLTTLLHSGNGSSEQLLRDFHDWLTSLAEIKNIYLWGNGILFDNKMIQRQFELIGLEYPIYYKNDRDVRTVLEIASLKTGLTEKKIKDMFTESSEKKHDAFDDVKYQVRLVSGCYRLIMENP